MAMSKDEMIQAIEQMSVLELADLVKALEERFGVSAAARRPRRPRRRRSRPSSPSRCRS
jgi:ribosomal protein L7/L12